MQTFNVHPKNPQERVIKQVAERLYNKQIGAIPTDSGYALISALDNLSGRERILKIRDLDEHHFFTLLCSNLEKLSVYANVNNANFKLIKRLIPGPYTFVLPSTKEVPKRLIHPKRKTIGIRVPDHMVVKNLITHVGEPLMSVSLSFVQLSDSYNNTEGFADYLQKQIDFFINAGDFIQGESTVIDCCQEEAEIIRKGIGELP